MRLFNLLVATLILSVCVGQTFTVQMDQQPKYYPMVGRSVGELYDIGSKSVQQSDLYQSIVFPENFNPSDTALAMAFFTGNKGETDPVRYVLIGNYTSSNFFLHCDRNGNLDFTDDGPAVQSEADSTATIYFSRDGLDGTHYGFRFKQSIHDSSTAAYFEKMFKRSPFVAPDIPQLNAKHWFFTHLLNIRSSKMIFNGDSVIISLQDANADGLISANGYDAFAIADMNTPLDFREHRNGVTLKESTVFQWKDQNYLITEFDSLGNYLEFKATELHYSGPVRPGNLLPEISVLTMEKRPALISEIKDSTKFTLLYLWGNWCKACHAGAQKLQATTTRYEDRLQVIGVNSGEPQETITQFTEKYQHTWPQYYMSGEFSAQLDAVNYPMYILLDREGRLVSYEGYPDVLESIIKGSD